MVWLASFLASGIGWGGVGGAHSARLGMASLGLEPLRTDFFFLKKISKIRCYG